ncbi:MAG: heavy metal-responsive transcriptional regulator [Acidimicrobiales bacterium]|nr:heavy metal-responsive transcriptional regulator [Acidimicrobiales bacterium]
MRIGALADMTGVPTKTIRYWESEGLIPAPARTPSGYRSYSPGAAERLDFIRHSQAAGLTLKQIRQILDISDDGKPPCEHVATAVADRLAEVDARLAELHANRTHLEQLAQRAATQDPTNCEGFCSIIHQ